MIDSLNRRHHGQRLLALLFLILPSFAGAGELSLKKPDDWKQLFSVCETDWGQYDADLNRLRTSVKRETDAMTEAQYRERWTANDPMIRFVRIHWPAIFESKDPGWRFYKNCSDLNWEVRKSLTSATESKAERQKKIGKFKDCVVGLFSRDPKPVPPFDSLLACYEKQANR
jgi:hypothetical protein